MIKHFTKEETLANGIYVRKKIVFVPCEYDQMNSPWIASINIGPWHYSQGGSTKEMAIANIYEYMQDMKKQFEGQLKRDIERLDTLNKFLDTQSDFCECSYPTADHVTSFNGTCGQCGKLVRT